MNINTFFTKLAFWEKWTVFFRMEIWASFVCIIAIRPMSASYFFLLILSTSRLLLLRHFFICVSSHPNIIFVGIQVNDTVSTIAWIIFQFLTRSFLIFLFKSLILIVQTFFLYQCIQIDIFSCYSLFLQPVKYIFLLLICSLFCLSLRLILFLQIYYFMWLLVDLLSGIRGILSSFNYHLLSYISWLLLLLDIFLNNYWWQFLLCLSFF